MNINVTIPTPSAKTQEFFARKHKLYIDGAWTEGVSGERIDVVDPGTGNVISSATAAVAADIDKAVAAARKAFESGVWANMPGLERGKLISKLARRLEELGDELAEIEAIDCGKPLAYAKYVDVGLTANIYHYMAGWAGKASGETVSLSAPGEYHAFTQREPVGVVAAITPWNFPLVLTAYKLAPLLAVGCTCVVKPSELTPLSTLRFAEIAEEVGFPPGVINVVTGYGSPAGSALVEHEGVDKVAFTGSVATGRKIAQAATGNLKRVTLELGGKSPMVVFPDADLDKAIPGLASAIFFHQGQVCTAGTRLYVHKSIHDRVLEGIAEESKKLKIGHGLEPDTTMGPMISSAQLQKVMGFLDQGKQEGAEVVTGGERIGSAGFFMQPTILANTTDSMSVVREEIFGPVLCAQSFSDDELDAIAAKANNTIYGLAASVWTRDISVAHKMAKRIKAGSVWINAHNFYDPALPFGGFKQSGWGREEGSEAIRTFTEVKSVCAVL
ncbi:MULTISPECIES: aldehyde dehydrogenase [unclassified Hyphomicrobium]|uniref:aldehyde dehydrogenase family protein n=1 Tax=unclassified Hyphomicrobium TaxID=2619925 RepID=UPI000213F857|nr:MULTISPECIES: aldehyde dehydrogenase family protein [unclassified Hyphomicrobium]CCB63434.1 putative aldehyde dehydrogenase dhaS [Hyphomicrobium sp. MC1]